MRVFASKLSKYLKPSFAHARNVSSSGKPGVLDDATLEADAERKVGWVLKLIFAGTATAVGYQFFPYMGDNLIQQSISLLQVNDPFFKRTGASRLTRFAVDDEKRMKIVEMGGSKHLVAMLDSATDDHTRKAALQAMAALSHADEAAAALYNAGAFSVVQSTRDSKEEPEVEAFRTSLLSRLREFRPDGSVHS